MNTPVHLAAAMSLAALALHSTAHATATYTYTAPITYWADGTGRGNPLYAGLDGSGMTLQFTTANPIQSVGSGYNVVSVTNQVLSWSFHGGGPQLNLGSTIGGQFDIALSTLAQGEVFAATFSVSGPVNIPALSGHQTSVTAYHGGGYDQETLNSDYLFYAGRDLHGIPFYVNLGESIATQGGTWRLDVSNVAPSTPVPEPDALSMGVAGLGVVLMLIGRSRWSASRPA